MSKFNWKEAINEVKETINKGVEKYTESRDKAEAKIMNKWGSNKTMERLDESMEQVGYKIKDTTIRTTTLIVEKSKPVCKKAKSMATQAKDKTVHVYKTVAKKSKKEQYVTPEENIKRSETLKALIKELKARKQSYN